MIDIIWSIELTKREPLIVGLERFEKSNLEEELDKELGYRGRTVFDDIESTYSKYLQLHSRTDIKISTDLVHPQIYKFMNMEVEIIGINDWIWEGQRIYERDTNRGVQMKAPSKILIN